MDRGGIRGFYRVREIFRAKKIYRECAQRAILVPVVDAYICMLGNSHTTTARPVGLNLRVPILLCVVFELIRGSYVIPVDTRCDEIYVVAECLSTYRLCGKKFKRKRKIVDNNRKTMKISWTWGASKTFVETVRIAMIDDLLVLGANQYRRKIVSKPIEESTRIEIRSSIQFYHTV